MVLRSSFLPVLFLAALIAGSVHATSLDTSLKRHSTNAALTTEFNTGIVLQGSLLLLATFKSWLNDISRVPIGRQTLRDIVASGHTLTIISTRSARISAGRTLAAMTDKLTNGTDDDVEIWFDGSVRKNGSHMVYNTHRQLVRYTAVENLFHRLVHAKHKMKGAWRYFDSEGQAIA